jgi:hypothetical protein
VKINRAKGSQEIDKSQTKEAIKVIPLNTD